MIAVAGGKGGCGKTTTTLGVARALVRVDTEEKPTKLQPSADVGPPPPVAADADWDLPNLAALAGRRDAPALTDAEALEGLSSSGTDDPQILDAPADPATHDPVVALRQLRRAVEDANPESPPPVLVDCPAGAGPDAAAPLRVADRSLLVTTRRVAALRDAAKTAALARTLDCPPIGVVLVRATSAPDGVAALFDAPVLATVPPAAGAPLEGGRVTAAYRRAARRLDA